jgi:hypothetical protein
VPITADNLPDDLAALKRIIAAMAQDALVAQAEIARLKFQLARYRRAEFGRSSEKLAREVEQLELALEALETDQAERLATASPEVAAAVETAAEAQKPARRPLPEHCQERIGGIPPRALVLVAAAGCARSPTRLARPWITCRAASESSDTFARSCRAGFAKRWWRLRRPITRLPAAGPGRGCSPISSCRNMMITCHFCDRALPVKTISTKQGHASVRGRRDRHMMRTKEGGRLKSLPRALSDCGRCELDNPRPCSGSQPMLPLVGCSGAMTMISSAPLPAWWSSGTAFVIATWSAGRRQACGQPQRAPSWHRCDERVGRPSFLGWTN